MWEITSPKLVEPSFNGCLSYPLPRSSLVPKLYISVSTPFFVSFSNKLFTPVMYDVAEGC